MAALPNFLYIGTSKAGSTWIFKVLAKHPQVYISPSKGLYFFCVHYDRGLDWYRDQFQPAAQHQVVGEISHSYLYSPAACQRIAEILPQAKLMVCLREPVDRVFSQYLDGIKNGKMRLSFEEELERTPALLERSLYATPLRRYIEAFGRERIHIALFDDLGSNPRGFAEQMFRFLDVEPLELPPKLLGKVLPAGTPRSRSLAYMAKIVSHTVKQIGFAKLRGKAKTSPLIRNLALSPVHKRISSDDARRNKNVGFVTLFADDVRQLAQMTGIDVVQRWGYSTVGSLPCGGETTHPLTEPPNAAAKKTPDPVPAGAANS